MMQKKAVPGKEPGKKFIIDSEIKPMKASELLLEIAPVRQCFNGLPFLGQVHLVPVRKVFEIDLVSVKLRAVHAGKLDLVVYRNPATAAHTGTVNHNRIEAHNGFNMVRAGDLSNGPHHRDWADGKHIINRSAGIN